MAVDARCACEQAYRLLAEEMYAKGWDYPLHLGVTEARGCPSRLAWGPLHAQG